MEVVSQRDPWLVHDKLDVIVKSGALKDLAVVLGEKGLAERPALEMDGLAMGGGRGNGVTIRAG